MTTRQRWGGVLLLLGLLLPGLGQAQTVPVNSSLTIQGQISMDTLVVPSGNDPPDPCVLHSLFRELDATAGQQLKMCTQASPAIWTVQGDGGGVSTFDQIGAGTNTNALLMGTGGSLGPTGTGTITATAVADGDKGDISITGGVWSIDAASVALGDIANIAAGTILGNNEVGAGPPEALSVTEVKTLLGVSSDGEAASLSNKAIPLAGGNTIAGTLSEWQAQVTDDDFVGVIVSQYVPNKRVPPRTSSTGSATSLDPDLDVANIYKLTALTETLTIHEPCENVTCTNAPVEGELVTISVYGAGAQIVDFDDDDNAATGYTGAVGLPLPTTTVAGQEMLWTFRYDSRSGTWPLVGTPYASAPLAFAQGGLGSLPSLDDQLLVSDSTTTATWRTLTDCTGTNKAVTYTTASNAFGCNTISAMSNPMTTAGDIIYGGASGVPTPLAGAAGLLRGAVGGAPSFAELSGAVSTSGSNATTLATKYLTGIKSVTIDAPVTGDTNKVQWYFPTAVTVTRVVCSISGTTSITIQLDERAEATPNTAGTDVMTSALVCDATAEATTSFTNATIAARVPLNLQLTAASGTPTSLRVHVEYSID